MPGLKYFTVKVDRDKAGRLGLNATDIQDALRVWVDGRQLGIVLEGAFVRTPLFIRGEERLRRVAGRPDAGSDRTLRTAVRVELAQVADIQIEDGPVQIIREGAQRFATVLVNVRGRDLVGFVAEAKAARRRRRLNSTPDIGSSAAPFLTWGGQFENQQRASARLAIVLPIALGTDLPAALYDVWFAAAGHLVFCNVPFATIGGVIALWASGEFLSVTASVGFIALIGIAVLNGVVMISDQRSRDQGPLLFREAVMEGARRRLRPVMLTATIAALGRTPFLFASGPGSEIQKPLAVVVIGGLVTATLLTLILLPILYDRFGVPAAEKMRINEWKTPQGDARSGDGEMTYPGFNDDDEEAAAAE